MARRHRKLTKQDRHLAHCEKGISYAGRDHHLKAMGYGSYKAYLATERWHHIRRRVIDLKGSDCIICRVPATEIHHTRYRPEDLSGSTLDHLHPLCHYCHTRIEFDLKGRKVTMKTAIRKFDELIGRPGYSESEETTAPKEIRSNRHTRRQADRPELGSSCSCCGSKAVKTLQIREFRRLLCVTCSKAVKKRKGDGVKIAYIKQREISMAHLRDPSMNGNGKDLATNMERQLADQKRAVDAKVARARAKGNMLELKQILTRKERKIYNKAVELMEKRQARGLTWLPGGLKQTPSPACKHGKSQMEAVANPEQQLGLVMPSLKLPSLPVKHRGIQDETRTERLARMLAIRAKVSQ